MELVELVELVGLVVVELVAELAEDGGPVELVGGVELVTHGLVLLGHLAGRVVWDSYTVYRPMPMDVERSTDVDVMGFRGLQLFVRPSTHRQPDGPGQVDRIAETEQESTADPTVQ